MNLLNIAKQIIQEGKQVGILYHYTEPEYMVEILDSNTLGLHDGKYETISFTRSKDANIYVGHRECYLIIDGDKLSNNYKITPYADPEGEDSNIDEMEEIVKGTIINLNRYIIGISFPEDELDMLPTKYHKLLKNNI